MKFFIFILSLIALMLVALFFIRLAFRNRSKTIKKSPFSKRTYAKTMTYAEGASSNSPRPSGGSTPGSNVEHKETPGHDALSTAVMYSSINSYSPSCSSSDSSSDSSSSSSCGGGSD